MDRPALALYDCAEIVLKPVFWSIADRVGAHPVLAKVTLAPFTDG